MIPESLTRFDQISNRARTRIYALVADHYKRHPGSPWSGKYLVELEKSIKAFYKEMGEEYQEVFRDTLLAEMQDFYDRAVKEIKTAGTYNAILGKPDPKRVKYMLESSFEQVALKTDKMALDHIRSLRQISAEVFRDMSLTGNTRQAVSKALLDRAMTIPGFEFIDKSGQKWSAKSYFKMLARTELMNAGRASYDEKMAEEGYDVMKLSTSGHSCDKCARFEGKLFSLSGATPGLPTKADLEDSGVFHPNCTHSYSMVPQSVYEAKYNADGTPYNGEPLSDYKKSWVYQKCISGKYDHLIGKENTIDFSDRAMKVIVDQNGYSGKPSVLPASRYDRLSDSDFIKLGRGLQGEGEKYAKQFLYGEYHAGNGTHGKGIYASTDLTYVIRTYAANKQGGALVEFALPNNANIISKKNLRDIRVKLLEELDDEIQKASASERARLSLFRRMFSDVSQSAAVMRYDALDIYGSGVYNILNRSKCIALKDIVLYD